VRIWCRSPDPIVRRLLELGFSPTQVRRHMAHMTGPSHTNAPEVARLVIVGDPHPRSPGPTPAQQPSKRPPHYLRPRAAVWSGGGRLPERPSSRREGRWRVLACFPSASHPNCGKQRRKGKARHSCISLGATKRLSLLKG
jgi:hypothetical protein